MFTILSPMFTILSCVFTILSCVFTILSCVFTILSCVFLILSYVFTMLFCVFLMPDSCVFEPNFLYGVHVWDAWLMGGRAVYGVECLMVRWFGWIYCGLTENDRLCFK